MFARSILNRKAVGVGIGVMAVCLLILLRYLANDTGPARSSGESSRSVSRGAELKTAKAIEPIQSASGNQVSGQTIRTTTLSAEEVQRIEEKTATLRKRLAEIERAHFRFKSQRSLEFFTITAGVITPPSSEEMEEIYREITKGIESFKGEEALENKYRKNATRLLNDYANYRKPYKVLIAYIGDKAPGNFIELYADDEDSRLPDKNGHWIIDTNVDHYRMDETWGTGASWAAKRYGSLISVEPAP